MVRKEIDCLAIGDVMFDVYVGNFANPIHRSARLNIRRAINAADRLKET